MQGVKVTCTPWAEATLVKYLPDLFGSQYFMMNLKYAIILPRCWAHVMVVHDHRELFTSQNFELTFFQNTLPLSHR